MKSRILICGPSWIGDMVMAHSLVQLLQQRNPQAGIDMLAPEWSRSVARCMSEIRTVITLPFQHGELALGERRAFAQTLAGVGYGRCYILPNSFKSALVPWFAGIPERIGWRAEGRSVLLTDARRLDMNQFPKMHQRYAALAFDLNENQDDLDFPYPKLAYESAEMRSIATGFGLRLDDEIIALSPGVEFGSSKQWPIEHFVSLTEELVDRGFKILLVGSSKDVALCQHIAGTYNQQVMSLAGKTSVEQIIHLLPLCKVLVCHDSGLMHIGAALGVPLVAMYGSTSPEHTPPLSKNARIICKQVECSPCFKRECPFDHHQCMRLIKPAEVLSAVESVLHA